MKFGDSIYGYTTKRRHATSLGLQYKKCHCCVSIHDSKGRRLPETLVISLPKNVADAFGTKNNGEVTVTKVDKQQY